MFNHAHFYGIILVVGVLSVLSNPALACKCLYFPTVEESFEGATSVFIGTLRRFNSKADPPYATFRVKEIAKGDLDNKKKRKKIVYTDRTSCGLIQWFDEDAIGQKYLVYSYEMDEENPGKESTRPCSRTTQYGESEESLNEWNEILDLSSKN